MAEYVYGCGMAPIHPYKRANVTIIRLLDKVIFWLAWVISLEKSHLSITVCFKFVINQSFLLYLERKTIVGVKMLELVATTGTLLLLLIAYHLGGKWCLVEHLNIYFCCTFCWFDYVFWICSCSTSLTYSFYTLFGLGRFLLKYIHIIHIFILYIWIKNKV